MAESILDGNGTGYLVGVNSDNELKVSLSDHSGSPIFIQDTPFYKLITDSSSATVQYFGYANPGIAASVGSWLITKQTISGAIVYIDYADGNNKFDNIWNNRGSLSYS